MSLLKLKDKSFWRDVAVKPCFGAFRQDLSNAWDERYDIIPNISYYEQTRFYETGDRAIYHVPYQRRTRSLVAAAILSLMYPEKDEYLSYVQEMIWATCNQYAWSISAHTKDDPQDDFGNIDLTSAEMAASLAEICYLLSDRLDERIHRRVRFEIERRIFATYDSKISWFETLDSNWVSVCGANVGIALMYLDEKRFKKYLPRILGHMKNFISGFSDEGICMEGVSYWYYGFSNFTWFADMLYSYTDGQIDLFANAKVEKMARYIQTGFLKGNTSVSFSDGDRFAKVHTGLQDYLTTRYPQSVSDFPSELYCDLSVNTSFIYTVRELIYTKESRNDVKIKIESYDFTEAAQVIINRENYSVFAKAGDNCEQHNHNDVGSFIFSTDMGQIFCDLGAAPYTKEYFDYSNAKNGRYTFFNVSSLGHNVPIVNGKGQKYGKEYCGTLSRNGNVIEIEFSKAYGCDNLTELLRRISLGKNGCTLTDSFKGSATLTERFITTIEPIVDKASVIVGNTRLSWSGGCFAPVITKKTHTRHNGETDDVWCVDFDLKKGVTCAEFKIKTDK